MSTYQTAYLQRNQARGGTGKGRGRRPSTVRCRTTAHTKRMCCQNVHTAIYSRKSGERVRRCARIKIHPHIILMCTHTHTNICMSIRIRKNKTTDILLYNCVCVCVCVCTYSLFFLILPIAYSFGLSYRFLLLHTCVQRRRGWQRSLAACICSSASSSTRISRSGLSVARAVARFAVATSYAALALSARASASATTVLSFAISAALSSVARCLSARQSQCLFKDL